MIFRNLSVYWIHETWLDGKFIKEIEGYTILHHGLEKQVCKRGQNGVAIILSLEFTIYYDKSGSKPQVNPKISSSVEFGRFLGLKLSIIVKTVWKELFRKRRRNVVLVKIWISNVQITIQLKHNISRRYKIGLIKQKIIKRAILQNTYVIITDQKLK